MCPLPTFLVVGAMRSGTTSLARQLGAHPEVFMAPQKEVHFFDRHFERGADWYRRQFDGAGNESAIGEATPYYLYDPMSLDRLARLVPDALLVAILREPVQRAYSHYWHSRARGHEKLSFRDAIVAEPSRLDVGDEVSRRRYSYLDRGRYLPQLERVVAHFPRESLHVALFDDLTTNPQATLSEICRFLGVDDSFRPPASDRRANKYTAFRSARVQAVARRLPWPLSSAVGRLNARSHEYEPMDSELRQRLMEEFRPHNEALAEWLGRDLSAWMPS